MEEVQELLQAKSKVLDEKALELAVEYSRTIRNDLRNSYSLLFGMQRIGLKLVALADPLVNTDVYAEMLELLAGVAYGQEDTSRIRLLHLTTPLAKELTDVKRLVAQLINPSKATATGLFGQPPPLGKIIVSTATTTATYFLLFFVFVFVFCCCFSLDWCPGRRLELWWRRLLRRRLGF